MLSCACFGNSRRKKAEGFNTSPQEHTGNENHANLDHTDHDHVGHDHVDHDHADHDLADQDHVDQDYVDQDHVDQDHVDQDHVDQDHGDQDHPIQHKHNESLAGEGQDSGKSIVQELWKAAFRNLEDENGTLMKKFKELMKLELKDLDPAKSTHLNAEEDWNLMEAFVSSQVPHALDPAKGKVLNGLDQAFRILRGIIDLINEPIKLAPQAAVPWAGVNIAVTVISNPLLERKANLDGLQAAFDKLNWYREIAADLFQSEEAGHTILRQRDLLKIKMVDYFQKLLLYQIRSILLLHTNKVLVAIRGVAKFDNWEQQLKEIKEAETELDSRIEQYQNRREREEKEQRQKEETRNMCLNALEVPDPKYDKRRILQDKGGLVPSCCDWIREEQQLEQRSFLNWINDPEKSIFWITGKAGKGKTMLVCDLIQGLEETLHKGPLFYTFCEISKSQSADYNATTLRGLIYTIASQHPSLTHYIRAEWDKNHSLFKDVNARLKSYDILKAILVDDVMNGTIIFVDALDECGNDLDLLLDLITTISNIKWVVSSRSNTNLIDEKLSNSPQCQKVSLDELGDLVTTAVAIYIEKQVHDLKQIKKYTDDDSLNIRRYLMKHAEGTFLWVALACKELWDPDTDDDALEVLNSLPRGLDAMYERMMGKIQTAKKERTRLFEIILSVNLVVSRSITIDEFLLLVKSSKKLNLFKDARHLQQMTEKCGYFFTISHGDNALSSSGNFINFVHKSAKDYLLENRSEKVPLPGLNYDIFQRCLEQMSEHLRRDMLDLKHPGAIPTKEHPALKRLNRIEYACTCWAEHIDCNNHVDNTCKEYGNSIQDFLSNHFLCWIEALSLLGKLSAGAMALQKLKDFAAEIWDLLSEQSVFDFDNFVDGLQGVGISRDGETIVIITDSEEAYLWDLKKKTNFKLDGSYSTPLIFSNDSKLLAMQATWDDEIWVWDIDSRKIIRKFEGHDDIVRSMAFSPDSRFLASNTGDRGNPGEDYTKIWDINTVNLELTDVVEHEEKTNAISHVSFSKEGKWLAVVSEDSGIDLWDNSGTFICRVSDQEDVRCISFSWDSMKLAFGTVDGICGIANISPKPDTLDTSSRKLIPEGGSTVTSLSFSRDDMLLAAVVIDRIRFFNIETGKYCQTQHPKPNEDEYFGHYREDPHICAVNFYKNSLAVSIAENGNAQMWNTVTGECLKEFRAESPKNIYGMVSAAIDVRLYQDSLQLISTSEPEGWKLYITDVETERRVQISETCATDFIEFALNSNNIISTRCGNIDLNQLDLNGDQHTFKATGIIIHGYGLGDDWIQKDGKPIIWLPPEYRMYWGRYSIGNSQIAIATISGRFVLIDFAE
ncbi:uncharacterized protein Triagg1_10015 [Trichoderma aggressivum f. europaeum]|uniref:NACHT domain-containing protein n=1 Tax=Trichoderma aggressivum f. europaeum TaxID=173218 RepID=A0AAE1I9M7_9HYPO|nr:hypothetical protein Triagg1_10015 [Trichoderma aggressivum f. europaeum]